MHRASGYRASIPASLLAARAFDLVVETTTTSMPTGRCGSDRGWTQQARDHQSSLAHAWRLAGRNNVKAVGAFETIRIRPPAACAIARARPSPIP